MLVIISFLIFLVCVGVSVLTKNYRVLTVWNFFTCFVFLNIFIRCLYIEFGIASEIIDPWLVFLPGLSYYDLVEAGFFYLAGVVALSCGYLVAGRTKTLGFFAGLSEQRVDSQMSNTLINRLSFVLLLSVVSFIYYVESVLATFSSLELLVHFSGYRGVSNDLESYSARGYIRLFIGFSSIVNLFSFYLILKKHPRSTALKIQFSVSFLVALLMAIFTSSRASMVFLILNLFFLRVLVLKRLPKIRTMIVGLSFATILFFMITGLRSGSGIELEGSKSSFVSLSAPVVLNNGGLDLSKTILVKRYVDDTFDFKIGSTLLLFIPLAVPRSLWPGKPVNLDTFIGWKIYGNYSYGSGAVPPGFPAELYLNFHYLGYLIGMFLLGVIARLLHNHYVKNHQNVYYSVYFVSVVLGLLNGVMGSGFSSVVMSALIAIVPIKLLLSKPILRH
ncbi:oligosaccharide repeat unit polymerase [Pseudomonadales bacterium]|nr:oligosaccharide repeat unit polymerase [Pseudomonadales bacterium]